MAKPEEIGRGIVFLASPASSYTTGTNLVIDGALTRGVQLREASEPGPIAGNVALRKACANRDCHRERSEAIQGNVGRARLCIVRRRALAMTIPSERQRAQTRLDSTPHQQKEASVGPRASTDPQTPQRRIDSHFWNQRRGGGSSSRDLYVLAPCPHPALRATFSRREKGSTCALSPCEWAG